MEKWIDHEEIKKKSLFQFRNATSLLGEVYNRLRIASLPLRILEEPLLHYMRILLDICEEIDIELVTTQVILFNCKENLILHSKSQTVDFLLKTYINNRLQFEINYFFFCFLTF